MVFSSVIFLWVLLPVILGCYYLSPRPFRNGLLMVFSLFFYAWGEPKYVLLGGVIGAGITWTVIKSMEMLGPAKAVLSIVVMQILTAYLIELFGMFGAEKTPFEWRKVLGLLVAIVGLVIFEWES